MKNISRWAAAPVQAARALIISIRFLLIVIAIWSGLLLSGENYFLPYSETLIICLLGLLLGIGFYPSFKEKHKRHSYIRQKFCDFLLPLCSFVLITAVVNNLDNATSVSPIYAAVTVHGKPTAASILAAHKKRADLTRQEKRILKKEFYHQLSVYAAAKLRGDSAQAGEAWKVALAIVGLLGLFFLLASLACSLSCNGSDAAAVIVAVLGLVGLIWGFIAVLKAIKRGPRPPTHEKDE